VGRFLARSQSQPLQSRLCPGTWALRDRGALIGCLRRGAKTLPTTAAHRSKLPALIVSLQLLLHRRGWIRNSFRITKGRSLTGGTEDYLSLCTVGFEFHIKSNFVPISTSISSSNRLSPIFSPSPSIKCHLPLPHSSLARTQMTWKNCRSHPREFHQHDTRVRRQALCAADPAACRPDDTLPSPPKTPCQD